MRIHLTLSCGFVRSFSGALVLLGFIFFGALGPAEAEYRLHFVNGTTIVVDSYQDRGDSIAYERFGGMVTMPKTAVVKIENLTPPRPTFVPPAIPEPSAKDVTTPPPPTAPSPPSSTAPEDDPRWETPQGLIRVAVLATCNMYVKQQLNLASGSFRFGIVDYESVSPIKNSPGYVMKNYVDTPKGRQHFVCTISDVRPGAKIDVVLVGLPVK